MTDVTFAARLIVTREADDDGLPVLTATLIPAEVAAAQPLPAGPQGEQGPRGLMMPTFRKVGEIADAAARPAGLTADDRGKWWHRLDDDGMDVWTGAGWVHSPGAVGEQGPPAPDTAIVATTTHDAALTVPAATVTGAGPTLALSVTAPAGLPGEQGPPGASGAISAAPDFDSTTAATNRGMFVWSAGGRRWRPAAPPNGFGPWSFSSTDFNASAQQNIEKLVAATLTMPVLPFRWRPLVFGSISMFCEGSKNADVEAFVRISSAEGVAVGMGGGARADNMYIGTAITPAFGDNDGTRALSPSSTYGTIPALAESQLLVTVERIAGSTSNSAEIGFSNGALSSLVVFAIPVGG